MSKIEQLTCPACGAHDVSQLSGINYQCNYCHSTFIVKTDNPFHKFNKSGGTFSGLSKEEILEKLKKGEMPFSSESAETFYSKVNVPKMQNIPSVKPARLAGIIIGIVVMILVGAGTAIYTITNNAIKSSKDFFADWQKPELDSYNCLVGSKGAVVWLTVKTQTNKLDSVKYRLRLIDPVTKKIITEEPLGKPKAWKELFNQSKLFDNDFYVVNDTAYNVSEDGGIQGFDLYTGKRLFGNEWLESKFPELKDGIAKVDRQYYKKRVKISSAAGDDFYFYPDTKVLAEEKKHDRSEENKPVFTENIYLSQNKKSQLYLCTMKRRRDDDFYLSESYIEQYKSQPSYVSSYIKEIKPLGSSVYAKALPIKEHNNQLLFFYASDFSKHADGVLAMVDKEGNLSWKNTDTTLKKLVKDNSSDNIYLNYKTNNELVVININTALHQSIGVNLKTGKTEFVFNQPYSID